MTGFLAKWSEDRPSSDSSGRLSVGHFIKSRETTPILLEQTGQEAVGAAECETALAKRADVETQQRGSLKGVEDRWVADAMDEIASLLATAYQRYTKIRRVAAEDPVNKELALCAGESVHGHGQQL
jgi:hypothetical protein